MAKQNKHNGNQDPIEELFRNKTEEYDISYRESDWKSLEKRLDAVDEQYYTRRKRNIAAAVLLLIFSVMAFVIYQNYTQINRLDKELTQAEQALDNNEKKNQLPPEEDQTTSLTGEKNESAKNPGRTQQNERGNSQNNQSHTTPAQEQERFAIADTSLQQINSANINCEICQFNDLSNNKNQNNALVLIKDNQSRNNISPSDQDKEQITGNTSPFSARSSISLVAGPDLSAAGSLSEFNQAGTKLGITFNYQISENVGISLGAIHSDVRYTAGSGEYDPPSGYWNYGVQASKTFARCIIIDIPLSVSYRLAEFPDSRLSASATAASYIMISEDYQFSYNNSGYNLPQQWNKNTGTIHLFSNVGFSIGYEYDLARNISIKAEPFVRIPVKGVGWGNVKLYSMGTLLSLTYNLH